MPKGKKTAALSRKAKKQVAKIARAAVSRGKESKLICSDYSAGLTLSTSWSTTNLFSIAQGDGATTRDGNTVDPTKLRMKFALFAATTSPALVRVFIIQWNRGVDSVELPTGMYSCVPRDASTHYRVLHDRMYNVNAAGATTGGFSTPQDITMYGKKLHRMHWNDTSTTGVSADEGGKVQLLMQATNSSVKIFMDIQQFFKEV